VDFIGSAEGDEKGDKRQMASPKKTKMTLKEALAAQAAAAEQFIADEDLLRQLAKAASAPIAKKQAKKPAKKQSNARKGKRRH
jgi:hypothetical protein